MDNSENSNTALHFRKMRALARAFVHNKSTHLLIFEGPAGWGKSFTVEQVLREEKISFASIGSVSTPLYFYNELQKKRDSLVVLDDCAGLLNDPKGLSILKAASWSSVGSEKSRHVAWGSTSNKVEESSFIFSGKLILLTNTRPAGPDGKALLSRSYHYQITHDVVDLIFIMKTVSKDQAKFPNQTVAKQVVDAITERFEYCDPTQIDLRTLEKVYELAISEPNGWKFLLGDLIPPLIRPLELVQELSKVGGSVEDQVREFIKKTGRSRRTFFNYRRSLGLRDANVANDQQLQN